jgi:hypothetical protein
VDPIDPVIGVRNPDRFAEKIRDGKYPENNISLIQIADKYRQTISNDPTGERFLKICEFIYTAPVVPIELQTFWSSPATTCPTCRMH